MRFKLSGLFVLQKRGQPMESEIDFEKMQGLAPAIAQDAVSAEVLMLGFMNREALELTLRSGYVTFFSRTRNQLWTKGETSGNRAQVISISTDCDRDTLLLRVRMLGDGLICHRGTRSSFTESVFTESLPRSPEFSGATE